LATVELVADLTCPWCYLGFRRLRRLQGERGLRLIWRPFLLNPHLPPSGVERQLYRARKFGSEEAARRLDRRLLALGSQEGISFVFERITRTSWTVAAHGLVLEAQRRKVAEAIIERLFAAYFVHGRDLADPRLLEAVATSAGLAWAWQGGDAPPPGQAAVTAAHREAAEAGVNGVPLFRFGSVFSIAGAQPLEALRAVADLAAMRSPGATAAAASPATQGRQGS
jgi:predicted DsbA family dithiol-disulfide isomerase